MHKQIESLIELAYREWKTEESKKSKKPHLHPELLASLLEKPLPDKEHRNARLHIVICEKCSDSLAAQFNTEIEVTQEIPPDLINWAEDLYEIGLAKNYRSLVTSPPIKKLPHRLPLNPRNYQYIEFLPDKNKVGFCFMVFLRGGQRGSLVRILFRERLRF
jgi:hypothetical protein